MLGSHNNRREFAAVDDAHQTGVWILHGQIHLLIVHPQCDTYSACSWVLKVIIEGFKSYKDQTISEPLDQHINVVGELPICSKANRLVNQTS